MQDLRPGGEFLERARREARRYGSDPWVFVRELIQNARDAGAARVAFWIETLEGRSVLGCRDDGEGMTLAHARRFLFTLYASSKRAGGSSAGRFGVGFWSVLRYQPDEIWIRSWPLGAPPWQRRLDGGLGLAPAGTPPPRPGTGTEILLIRRAGPHPDETQLAAAVRSAVRDPRLRDDAERALELTVGGRRVRTSLELPAPSARFSRRGVRGVVGLGAGPRVELSSKGLLLRKASVLSDLLQAPEDGATPAASPVRGMAPQALLDDDGLSPLPSRGDARDDRQLRRLVALARRETERLVAAQVESVRPGSRWRRLSQWLRPAVAAPVALLLVAVAGLLGAGVPAPPALSLTPARLPRPGGEPRPAAAAYRDLATLYEGPRADAPVAVPPVALRYDPARTSVRFAALLVRGLDPSGRAIADEVEGEPYRGPACRAGCVEVRLEVAGGPGPLRIPVPTGTRVDPASVRLDDGLVPLHRTALGQPVLELTKPTRGELVYRAGPARPAKTSPNPAPPPLPRALASEARRLRSRPLPERVSAGVAWVRARVRHDSSPRVVERHAKALALGRAFADRTLAIGAGDCDVQNGLLLDLLQTAGVTAHLAVGYVGESGRAAPALHAWVEYRDLTGRWAVADASEDVARAEPLPAPPHTPRSEEASRGATEAGPGSDLALPVAIGGAGILLAALIALALGRPRTRRRILLAPDQPLHGMLRAALEHPEAFQDAPALFHRPLVPTQGGGFVSLAQAWQEAEDGRLFRAPGPGRLERSARRRGLIVLPEGSAEATVVADALGAVDLGEWEARLARAARPALVQALERQLRRHGERWVLAVDPRAADAAILRLPSRGLARLARRSRRHLLLPGRAPWLRQAETLFAWRPGEAVLRALDRILEPLGLPDARRAELLAPLARRALLEAAG